MPVTKPYQCVDPELLFVNNTVADLVRQDILVDLNLHRRRPYVERKCFVVGKLHSHKIERHHDAVVARFQGNHQTNIQIGKDVKEAGVYAGVMAQRTDRAVHPGEPQIGGKRHVPSLIRPLLRSLGIQVPRGNGFHAFRHANATLMNSFGASQKLRQRRLGHADGSPVTETIYTHVISEDGKRIAAQLGKAVWGVLDPSWTLKENGSGVESPKPLYLN